MRASISAMQYRAISGLQTPSKRRRRPRPARTKRRASHASPAVRTNHERAASPLRRRSSALIALS
jgi:hypothetical protein